MKKISILMPWEYLYYTPPIKLKEKLSFKSWITICRNCHKREAEIGEPLCEECYSAHYCRNGCGNKWKHTRDNGRCPTCSRKWGKLLKEFGKIMRSER